MRVLENSRKFPVSRLQFRDGTAFDEGIMPTQHKERLMADLAGNSAATARRINIGPQRQTFSDFVSPTDTIDLYSFRLTSRQSVRLNLNGLRADANLELRTQSGSLVAYSRNLGTTADTIEVNLGAGGYLIRVSPAGRSLSTTYRLDVAANPDGAGERLSTARRITFGSQATAFRDFVGWKDTDYYSFSVTGSSRLNLKMDGLTADANVQLLDSTGTVLRSSLNPGRLSESIAAIVSAGTYYIGVSSAYGIGTNYRLNMSQTPVAIDATPTTTVVGSLPSAVQEASGLAPGSGGTWWTHNDSGNTPTLYRLNSQGGLLQSVTITGATNVDWEDIASGTYNNQRVLFIGDFGNNTTVNDTPTVGSRTDQQIYVVAEPDANATSANVLATLAITYPNSENYDIEALAYDPVGAQLVLVSKDLTGVGTSRVFTRSLVPSETQLTQVGTFDLSTRPPYVSNPVSIPLVGSLPSYSVPFDRLVTSADISQDGNFFVIRTYQSAFLLTRNAGESIATMLSRQSQAAIIPLVTPSANILQAIQQDLLGEGIAFGSDGNLYTVNEKIQVSTLPIAIPPIALSLLANVPDPHLTKYTIV